MPPRPPASFLLFLFLAIAAIASGAPAETLSALNGQVLTPVALTTGPGADCHLWTVPARSPNQSQEDWEHVLQREINCPYIAEATPTADGFVIRVVQAFWQSPNPLMPGSRPEAFRFDWSGLAATTTVAVDGQEYYRLTTTPTDCAETDRECRVQVEITELNTCGPARIELPLGDRSFAVRYETTGGPNSPPQTLTADWAKLDESAQWQTRSNLATILLEPTCFELPVADFTWAPGVDNPLTVELTPKARGSRKSLGEFHQLTDVLWSVEGIEGAFPGSPWDTEIIDLPGPGDYQVTLTVRDETGFTDTVTKTVTVAPPFTLQLEVPDHPSGTITKGETFTVNAVLEVAEGQDLWLDGYSSTDVFTVEPAETITITDPPAYFDGIDLVAGSINEIPLFTAQADEPGELLVRATLPVIKSDGSLLLDWKGAPITATAETRLRINGGLQVTVTPERRRFELNVDIPGNRYTVEVRVTNTTDRPITDVQLEGHLAIGAISVNDTHKNSHILDDPLPNGVIGTLQPGETSRPIIYHLEGLRAGTSELSAAASGMVGNAVVRASGRSSVQILDKVFVKIWLQLEERPQWLSGHAIRIRGRMKNVTDDRTVGVVIYPSTDGNAGNGALFPADSSGPTPTGTRGWVLQPGQEVELRGIAATLPAVTATDATISYTARAWLHKDDGTKPNVDDEVEIVVDDTSNDTFTVRLLPNPPIPDDDLVAQCGSGSALWYGSCGLLIGVGNFLRGFWDMGSMLGSVALNDLNYGWRLLVWNWMMLGDALQVLRGDEQALQRIIDEIVLDLESLKGAGALTLQQGVILAAAVKEAVLQSMDKWVHIVHDGDLESLSFELGRLAGENADQAGLALMASSRFARKVLREALETNSLLRKGMEKAAEATRDLKNVDELFAKARQLGKSLPESGLIQAGAKLTFDIIERGWGASRKTVEQLQEIARKFNVMIAFRARAPEAMRLIERGLARLKPELMKIKSVNEIDIRYLGYRGSRKAVVELVEPPIPIGLKGKELEEAAEKYVREVLMPRHPELATDPDLAYRVQKRLQLRTEEYPLYLERFEYWSKYGIDVGFDFEKQGLSVPAVMEKRQIRMQLVEGPDPNRKYFEILMDGDDGKWLPVAGDLDLVAILNPTGTMIMNQRKRFNIYESLRTLLGIQHGETHSYMGPLRASWLEGLTDGKEMLVVVHPNGDLRAGTLLRNKSILPDSNYGFRLPDPSGDFLLISGAGYQLKSKLALGARIVSRNLEQVTAEFFRRSRYFLPGKIFRFLNGMGRELKVERFTRAEHGVVLQPDGQGEARLWRPEQGWSAENVENLPLSQSDNTVLLSPQSVLVMDADKGSRLLAIGTPEELGMAANSPWFEPGDVVVIDPGTDAEEYAVVAGLGSLRLTAPLKHPHIRGAMVALARLRPCAAAGDRDGDGVRDCDDRCADDPSLEIPGPYGCGGGPWECDADGRPEPADAVCQLRALADTSSTLPDASSGTATAGPLPWDADADGRVSLPDTICLLRTLAGTPCAP